MEETLIIIFFSCFDFGIFRFGVCMIEAISCTQTEFLLVEIMELLCFDMSVIVFVCFTIAVLGSGVAGGLFLAH